MDKFTVTFDSKALYDSLRELYKNNNYPLYLVAEEVVADTEEYVPMNTGALRRSATVESKTKQEIDISYERIVPTQTRGDIDIAEYLYEGINYFTGEPIKEWTTPGTGPEWLEVSVEENFEDWVAKYTDGWREYRKVHR